VSVFEALRTKVQTACRSAQHGQVRTLRDRYILWDDQEWQVIAVNLSRGQIELRPLADPKTSKRKTVDEFCSKGFLVIERPDWFKLGKVLSVADRAWALAAGAMEPADKATSLRDLSTQTHDDGEVRMIAAYVSTIQAGGEIKRLEPSDFTIQPDGTSAK
jgi:hypothetical protein